MFSLNCKRLVLALFLISNGQLSAQSSNVTNADVYAVLLEVLNNQLYIKSVLVNGTSSLGSIKDDTSAIRGNLEGGYTAEQLTTNEELSGTNLGLGALAILMSTAAFTLAIIMTSSMFCCR